MKVNSIRVNAFWNIFANIVNMLLLFILTPIITKGLGDVGYGIYVILSTISGALSIINLGLGEATLRYVSYYYGRNDILGVNRVFNATLCLYTLLGLAVTLIFSLWPSSLIEILNLQSLGHEGPILIRFTLVAFLLSFISGCLGAIPQALQRYDIASYINIAQNLIRFVVNIVIIYMGYGLYGLVVVNLLISLITLIVQIFADKNLLPTLSFFRIPKLDDYKEIFSYGVWAFLGQLFGIIWQYCDNILLSIFLGPQFVGYFSIPMQIIGKAQGLISSGTNVLFPKFSSQEDNPTLVKELYVKSTEVSLLTSILIFVPLCVLFPDFLALWISRDFADKTSFIAPVLAFSYIIRGAFLPYESLLKGLGFPKYIMYITVVSSLLILVLDVTLIPLLGLNGLGFAYVLSSLVGVFVIYIIWKKFIKRSLCLALKLFMLPYVSMIFILFLFLFVRNSICFEVNIYSFLLETVIVGALTLLAALTVYLYVDTDLVMVLKSNLLKRIFR